MNAVEIEEAISDLAEQTFVPAEFPYAFLEAFGNKNTPDFHIMDDLKGEIPFENIGFFKDCKLYLTIW